MTRSSRDKLNSIYAGAAIGIAAVFGAIARSWVLFILIAASLFAVFGQTGQIRSPSDRRRNKRK
jgi:hypothetical protein